MVDMKRTLFDTHENTATLQMAYPDGPFWTTAAPFRVPLLVMERKCLVLILYWVIIKWIFCATAEALETTEILILFMSQQNSLIIYKI